MTPSPSPWDRLPSPLEVHHYLGHLLREVALVRRLLRLTQKAREQQPHTTEGATRPQEADPR